MAERSESVHLVTCYLCGERRPEGDTEITRYRVPSTGAVRGRYSAGVHRYVRMCRVGFGCKVAASGGSSPATNNIPRPPDILDIECHSSNYHKD